MRKNIFRRLINKEVQIYKLIWFYMLKYIILDQENKFSQFEIRFQKNKITKRISIYYILRSRRGFQKGRKSSIFGHLLITTLSPAS